MKSGKKKTILFEDYETFDPNDYEHSEANCKGTFKVEFQTNTAFNFDILGPVKLPILPLVSCNSCQATYELEKYMRITELFIAFLLLQNQKLLTKKQLKFLRVIFNKSQADVAELLRVDRSHYTKMESLKGSVAMQADQQVRVKIFYLHKLEDLIPIPKEIFADIVVKINSIDDLGLPIVDSDLLSQEMKHLNDSLKQAFG